MKTFDRFFIFWSSQEKERMMYLRTSSAVCGGVGAGGLSATPYMIPFPRENGSFLTISLYDSPYLIEMDHGQPTITPALRNGHVNERIICFLLWKYSFDVLYARWYADKLITLWLVLMGILLVDKPMKSAMTTSSVFQVVWDHIPLGRRLQCRFHFFQLLTRGTVFKINDCQPGRGKTEVFEYKRAHNRR